MNKTEPRKDAAPNWRRLISPLLSAALGFLLATAVIHLLIRSPVDLYAQDRSEKLEMLKQTREAFRFTVFGSSHAHNGFDPRVFDQVIQEMAPGHSLNMAVRGGSQTEQTVLAQQYLQRINTLPRSDHMPVLMLEANAGVNFQVRHLLHPRTINIYDKNIASLAFSFTPASNDITKIIGRSGYATLATSLHYMNIGMLASQIFRPPINKEILAYETIEDRRGLEIEPYSDIDEREVLRAIANKPDHPKAGPMENTAGLIEVAKAIHSHAQGKHVALLFYTTPKLSDLTMHPSYPASLDVDGTCIPIIHLALPEDYPELYKSRYWHDPGHLNASGASLFSSLLARKIMELESSAVSNSCKVLHAIR